MNEGHTVVTGATGFIGRWLLADLTAHGRPVIALVRDGARRANELAAFTDAHGGDSALLQVIDADLHRADLGASAVRGRVRSVIHLAAHMDFGLSMEHARENNVRTTLNVARWAHERGELERFVLLGGYRMTRPEPELRAFEQALSEREVERLYRGRGAYEVSKHEAYWALRRFAESQSLPWTAVHPSSVIGDSRTGETTQLTGLATTVKNLYEGRMPAMVGRADSFVPIVAVDHLARVLATVDDNPETRSRDLVVLAADTPMLPALIAQIAARIGRRAPRWSLPVSVVRALPRWLSGVDREALDFIASDRYDTESAEQHMRAMSIVAPSTNETIDRWCDYLVRTRFLQRTAA